VTGACSAGALTTDAAGGADRGNRILAWAIFPASLALVAAVTTNARERARGIARWAGFLSVGAALSPLLGGTLASLGSWRAAYGVVAVLSALGASLQTANLPVGQAGPVTEAFVDPLAQSPEPGAVAAH
jgi:MFS family permease